MPDKIAVAIVLGSKETPWPRAALAADVIAVDDGERRVAVVPAHLLDREDLAAPGVEVGARPVCGPGGRPSVESRGRTASRIDQRRAGVDPGWRHEGGGQLGRARCRCRSGHCRCPVRVVAGPIRRCARSQEADAACGDAAGGGCGGGDRVGAAGLRRPPANRQLPRGPAARPHRRQLDDPYGRLGWQILLAARQGLPDLRSDSTYRPVAPKTGPPPAHDRSTAGRNWPPGQR